jgi:hypothetical protein
MRITLKAHPKGLTQTNQGRKLLTQPFIFQVGPIEEFKLTHAFNFGLYDTIFDGQYSRWGSRQLPTWSFDTLVLYMTGGELPAWVPFPAGSPANQGRHSPMWYRQQLRDLHNSGAPFKFVATQIGDEGPAKRCYATLTGFTESWKAGEVDCIYLEGVSFVEWRDPTATEKTKGGGGGGKTKQKKNPAVADQPPTTVKVGSGGVAVTGGGNVIPPRSGGGSGGAGLVPTPCTLRDLAKYFYHSPAAWTLIAKANGLKGVDGSTPLNKIKNLPAKLEIPEGPSGGAGLS